MAMNLFGRKLSQDMMRVSERAIKAMLLTMAFLSEPGSRHDPA